MSKNLYRIFWRWHFYAGLCCLPFIFVLSVSGGLYLFKPQIESFRENTYNNLQGKNFDNTANAHIDAALNELPGAKFESYRLAKNTNDAIRVSVMHEGARYYVYVNPFTLEVLDKVKFDNLFIEWVKNLHGELLAGQTGSLVVELVASWAVILIVTGIYLWWPRNQKSWAGIIYPRINRGKRTFLRDLHATVGIWVAFFTLFLLISGLPWTTVWGGAFKEIRKLSTAQTEASWSNSRSDAAWKKNAVVEYNLTPEILATAYALEFAWPSELSVSDSKTNEWKLASTHQNRPLRQTAWIDGATGQVVERRNFSDKSTLDQVIGIGIAAHEGHLFGWFNQVLGLVTVAGLVILTVSGFLMWRSRKPQQALGAPPPMSPKVPAMLFLPMLLLPVLLASFVIIFVIERVLLRHIPPIANWLGLAAR